MIFYFVLLILYILYLPGFFHVTSFSISCIIFLFGLISCLIFLHLVNFTKCLLYITYCVPSVFFFSLLVSNFLYIFIFLLREVFDELKTQKKEILTQVVHRQNPFHPLNVWGEGEGGGGRRNGGMNVWYGEGEEMQGKIET